MGEREGYVEETASHVGDKDGGRHEVRMTQTRVLSLDVVRSGQDLEYWRQCQ